MSFWAEEEDDDFFSIEAFEAYKKLHDEDMRVFFPDFIRQPIEPIKPVEKHQTSGRFTTMSRKKNWKRHTNLNK